MINHDEFDRLTEALINEAGNGFANNSNNQKASDLLAELQKAMRMVFVVKEIYIRASSVNEGLPLPEPTGASDLDGFNKANSILQKLYMEREKAFINAGLVTPKPSFHKD